MLYWRSAYGWFSMGICLSPRWWSWQLLLDTPMVGGWKHHRDGHRREILSCDRLWGKKIHWMSLPGRGGREMFGRDGTTGKACEGDTEYGGIRENGKEAATSGKVGRGCSVPFRDEMGAESRWAYHHSSDIPQCQASHRQVLRRGEELQPVGCHCHWRHNDDWTAILWYRNQHERRCHRNKGIRKQSISEAAIKGGSLVPFVNLSF